MKEAAIIILICASALLWAQTSIIDSIGPITGAGVNINFSNSTYSDKNNTGEIMASSSRLTLNPSAHFFLDEITEFIPYLSFGLQWNENKDAMIRDGSSTINYGGSQFTLGGGTSFLWHFLQTKRINLLTGFQFDLNYTFEETGEGAPTGDLGDPKSSQFNMGVYIPLGMDFLLTKGLTLRVSSELIRMGFTMENRVEDAIEETDYLTGSSFPFLQDGDTAITLSVIYYFGD